MEAFNKKETVVITGASAGVGRATAHEFAKRKARLGLIARARESLEDIPIAVFYALVLPLILLYGLRKWCQVMRIATWQIRGMRVSRLKLLRIRIEEIISFNLSTKKQAPMGISISALAILVHSCF
ncbi:MAG: hypothetical protein ACXWRE_07500 [Pseudobdellovibrionaceae bacterium]